MAGHPAGQSGQWRDGGPGPGRQHQVVEAERGYATVEKIGIAGAEAARLG